MKKTGFILCVLVACMLLLCASALAEESDFTIQDGVLTYYNGTDTEVVVPDGVTSIRSTAFNGNTTLQKVTLPASMKEIVPPSECPITPVFPNLPNDLR